MGAKLSNFHEHEIELSNAQFSKKFKNDVYVADITLTVLLFIL